MERVKRWICTLLAVCVILPLLPVTAWGVTTEEFSLTVGETYYFLVDTVARRAYFPFTYAGTINAYVLNANARGVAEAAENAAAATNANANNAKYGYTYDHSLFVAERNVLQAANWGNVMGSQEDLIYGKDYPYNGIRYTLRAMTGGSLPFNPDYTYGYPSNNEWDVLCSKGDYIKNATAADTWVQDTFHNDEDQQCLRGGKSLHSWGSSKTGFWDQHGYRPVLEIKDVGSLPSSMERKDALKVVNIDLNGGKLYSGEKSFNIIVKNNTLDFTAPSTSALTRPDGSWGDGYLMWVDEHGVKYYPGETVRRNVTKLTALWNYEGPEEQFDLTTGETYYFDLSTGISFTGTKNKALPDASMHYVPFTYVGTVNSYVLNSASAGIRNASAAAAKTTSSTGQYGYTYDHSLFISDYGLYEATWQNLNLSRYNLIFGRNYPANGVNYSLRAPSVGSKSYEPLNNECDAILNKDFGCIKNGDRSSFWGQDTYDISKKNQRSKRSGKEGFLRRVSYDAATDKNDYRPVLEILNDGTMSRDALRVVTLDLNNASFSGQRYLKMVAGKDCTFTAPSFAGITLPEGYDAENAQWKDRNGTLYATGDSVPADVSSLRLHWVGGGESQLTEGGTYWFDLSAAGYVGEKYGKLPDPTLHYVPFTYTGNINAYALDHYIQAVTAEYAQENRYDHSLFMADYPLSKATWDTLNDKGFLYGKDHAVNGVTYKLRAPSALGTSNGDRLGSEWDEVLAKGSYIKNWEKSQGAWGQDSLTDVHAACRGDTVRNGVKYWSRGSKTLTKYYRPVLEVTKTFAIGPTVTLDLNGSKLDGAEQLSIIVNQEGSAYTAPTAEGLPRPEGIEGDYFRWLGSDGELYAPGNSVSATVLTLTAQWTEPVSHTHVYGDWTFNNDATHTRTCTVAGCGHSESGSCTGSTATCTAASICGTCHGELAPEDPDNHTGTPEWTFTETEHQQAYTCCQKITVPFEPHVYDDDEALTCSTCGYKRMLPHRHDYDDKWLSDKTHHWQLCSDPDCPSPNEFGNRAAHVYDSEEDTICNTCGYERPAPHNHVFDGPYADKGDGTHSPTCSVEGCSEISPDSSSHTGGDAAKENVIAATCTTGGSYDKVVRCTECAAEISREHVTVDATGHSNGEPTQENVVDATCTTDGRYDEIVRCTTCKTVLHSTHKPTSATGHSNGEPTQENVVDATCTADGSYDEIVRCTKCKAEISNTHKTTSATGHNWDNWTVIKAATATADGEKMRVCAACSAQETEPIPATGGSEPEKPDKPDDKPDTNPDVTPDKPQPDDTGHSGAVRRYPARTEPDAAAESTDKTIRSGNTGDSGVALYAAAFLAAALGGLLLPKLRRRKTR